MAPQHLQHLRLCIDARNDAVHQVRTVERADQHRRILQAQLVDDVGAHALRGRRRVSVHAGLRKAGLELGELAVFRPEVVTPVADAVRLVDGERADLEAFDELQKARRQQALRRHEHQSIAAGGRHRHDDAAAVAERDEGLEGERTDPVLLLGREAALVLTHQQRVDAQLVAQHRQVTGDVRERRQQGRQVSDIARGTQLVVGGGDRLDGTGEGHALQCRRSAARV